MMNRLFVSLFAAAVLASSALAQAQHWEIDPAHSTVGFTVRHMTVSNVSGQFKKFTGAVEADPADPTKSTVKVEIETASIDTGNEKRDAHLKNPDFFDAAKFPTLTFASKKIEKSGDGYKMTGDLTMHGETKEVTLDVEAPTDAIKDHQGNQRRGLSATGKLNRQDFGVKWSKTLDAGGLVVGNDVKLKIDVELVQKADAPAGAASPHPAPATEKSEQK